MNILIFIAILIGLFLLKLFARVIILFIKTLFVMCFKMIRKAYNNYKQKKFIKEHKELFVNDEKISLKDEELFMMVSTINMLKDKYSNLFEEQKTYNNKDIFVTRKPSDIKKDCMDILRALNNLEKKSKITN